jgi:CcmD family protein
MSAMSKRSLPGRRDWRAGIALLVTFCVLGSAVMLFGGQPPPSPPGQSELVPISQLPPGEQLPAAHLLIGAYVFVWLALLAYLWSLWRRLGTLERELQMLARRLPLKRP